MLKILTESGNKYKAICCGRGMALILEGNSEPVAHALRKIGLFWEEEKIRFVPNRMP